MLPCFWDFLRVTRICSRESLVHLMRRLSPFTFWLACPHHFLLFTQSENHVAKTQTSHDSRPQQAVPSGAHPSIHPWTSTPTRCNFICLLFSFARLYFHLQMSGFSWQHFWHLYPAGICERVPFPAANLQRTGFTIYFSYFVVLAACTNCERFVRERSELAEAKMIIVAGGLF